MSILRDVATNINQKPKIVREVYEGLVDAIKAELKSNRKSRIPGLGILAVKYRPPREKRKGINPFTKEPTVFKARAASNKAKFRPAKDLKLFVDKLDKVAPKKKKKGGKSSGKKKGGKKGKK